MKGILATVILVETMTVVVNAVPHNLTYDGRKYASDGKLLLQILFGHFIR